MESIDDLLADLKAEYEEKDKPKPSPKQEPLKQVESKTFSGDWEDKAERNKKASLYKDNADDDGAFKQKKSPQLPPIPKPKAQLSWQQSNIDLSSAEYGFIDELKAEFQEKERLEELKRQEQLREEQLRQERIKQQQKQALKKEAEEWLKKLNPRSEEGLWFEEFAYSYPSKLEAAIDYLQALKETGFRK
jgi:hypothetical protein